MCQDKLRFFSAFNDVCLFDVRVYHYHIVFLMQTTIRIQFTRGVMMKKLAKLTTVFLFTTSFGILANTTEPQMQSQENAVGTQSQAATPKGIDITIKSSTHPKGEPKGLYIVDFRATSLETNQATDHTYRVYCPTSTVRNITANQKTGDLMTAVDEDAIAFNNGTVLQKVVQSVCANEG